MGLSNDLISQFVKATKAEKPKKTETTSYGTIVESDGSKWVKLDGSDQLTPINTTAVVADGDRVTVLIKDHNATVTGNLSDPAASSNKVTEMVDEIAQFEIVVADKVSTKELEAQVGRIDTLVSDNVIIKENLTAAEADISELRADNVTISGKLTAAEGEITNLKTDKLDASIADIKYATIGSLEATDAKIYNLEVTYGEFEDLVAEKFVAIDAEIENLDVGSLTVEEADIRYATIESLNAAKADITDLNADVANIDTLIFGSASGNVISTNFANAVIAQLGNAQIKSAMIESIAADKITAGDIITNNVRVVSEDGKLLISDETIQISDETRVRVQIGKDASGDYSINIWDADGNLMFSEGGITDNAIKEAIIRNDMVSENANIDANKLNIDSLFTVINEDGSNTLSSSKILLDADNQTLDVAFKNMTTKVETVEETINLTQAAVNQNAADMAQIVLEFNANIENLQTQIDGGITTWFYEVPPSADNEPESVWITDEMKNTHLGDLYYDTEAGTCYRYMLQDGEYFWQQVSDTDVAKALEDAKAAKDLADQKRRVFYEQPKPPYDKGDLWVQGANGDILRCQTTKTATQSFDQSDWVLASKYTDDTAADAVMAEVVTVKETVSTHGTDISVIQGQINSKIWQQDINESITTLDGEFVEKTNELTTKYSEIDQKVNGISTTVSEHTSKISEKADSSTVTEVSNKVSNLEQDVDGFKTTVSNTYVTNDTLTGYSTTSQMNTAIEESAKGISQSVSNLEKTLTDNYWTSSKTESQINQTANGITSKVTSLETIVNTKNQTFEGAGDPNYTGLPISPLFTNLVDSALSEPGGIDIFNEIGYIDHYRWSSSGNSDLAYTNGRLTGWISYIPNATYRIKNMGISFIQIHTGYVNGYYVVCSKDGNITTNTIPYSGNENSIVDVNNDLITFTPDYDCDYFRISGYSTNADESQVDPPIITCNEEITYDYGNPNSPSVAWKDEGAEANHVGDLYIDSTTGYLYRWELNDGVYSWERVKDGDINEAQNWADKAQSEIDAAEIRLSRAESNIEQLSNSIVTMVTDENGKSVMQQTSTGWTFNISGMEEMVSDTSANVGSLQDRVDGIDGENGSISVLQNEVNQLKSDTEYVRMGTIDSEYGDGVEPCLELGEGDTEFGLKITNTRMIFEDSTGDPTRISKDGLYTNTLTVGNEIRQGSWVWAERANGNYGLMYRGGE